MIKLRGKLTSLCVLALLLVCVLGTQILASNDKYYFSGLIVKTYFGNTSTSPMYRNASDDSNSWKAALTYTEEADGTGYTDFWIEDARNGDNVSSTYTQSVKMGPRYHKAKSASKMYVVLTMENNNYSGNSYKVSGYWDEETDIYVD